MSATILLRHVLRNRLVLTLETGWHGGPFTIVWTDVESARKPDITDYRTFKKEDAARAQFATILARHG